MARATEELRLRPGESLSGCLSARACVERPWFTPPLALESGQSQDEYPQVPGSSGQHWVLCDANHPSGILGSLRMWILMGTGVTEFCLGAS